MTAACVFASATIVFLVLSAAIYGYRCGRRSVLRDISGS
jgi:hypothetical protein